MKKSSNSISPFLILLIPALLIIGFKSSDISQVSEEKYHASTCFQMPALKGVIKAFFFAR